MTIDELDGHHNLKTDKTFTTRKRTKASHNTAKFSWCPPKSII